MSDDPSQVLISIPCLPFQVFFSRAASQQTAAVGKTRKLCVYQRAREPEELLYTRDCTKRISGRGCPADLRHHPGDYEAPRSDVLHSEENSSTLLTSNRPEPRRT